MSNRPYTPTGRAGFTAAVLGITMCFLAPTAGRVLASPSAALQKLMRQINVMSRIVDQVLLDSPNFLVRSGTNVTGFYLPDYGAVFAFDASLTDETFATLGRAWLPSDIDIRTEDGDRTIIIKRKHLTESDEAGNSKGEEGKGKSRGKERNEEKREKRDEAEWKAKDPARLYDLGKDELVQMLVDNADMLSALPQGESVVVVANIRNDRLWKEKKRQQLQLRVGGDDLKSYADDRLSEKDLRSRIQVDEF